MREIAEQNRFNRPIAIFELTTVATFIMLQIWVFEKKNLWGAYLAAALIVGGWIARKEDLNTLGLIKMPYAVPILIVFLGKMILAHFGLFHIHWTGLMLLALRVPMYFVWATVQELILIGFFVNRLCCVTDEKLIPLWAGTIFCLVHLPNPILMVPTFLGGIVGSYYFLRIKRNLYFIASVHAVVGTMILYWVPQSLHHHMAVGPKFWR
jgi:CAAX prenyl protease-like protein